MSETKAWDFTLHSGSYRVRVVPDSRGGYRAKLISVGIGTIMEPHGKTQTAALTSLARELYASDSSFDRKMAKDIVSQTSLPIVLGSQVRAHSTKKRAIPGVSTWSMTAGGTGAAPDKHGYNFFVPEGTYRIWPYTTQLGRHAGYMLKFSAEGGSRPRGSHGGLWHDLGSHNSPQKAASAAAAHYAKGFE